MPQCTQRVLIDHDQTSTSISEGIRNLIVWNQVATKLLHEVISPLDALKLYIESLPMAGSSVEVAIVFRQHGAYCRQTQQGHLNLNQLEVVSAIERCRSVQLG